MSLTREGLRSRLQRDLDLEDGDARDLVDAFFEEIVATLESGEDVKLSGFGNFHLLDKEGRRGRNPNTGEAVTVSARRVVSFKASPILRDRVNRRG